MFRDCAFVLIEFCNTIMIPHSAFMLRCLELAAKGGGYVAPNPMVGAVLVYQDQIIGEGWHKQYGDPHAEVNCLQSVKPEHQSLIAKSTLYVSLEPCAHHGKTPPCTDLIIRHAIPRVVIGCTDTFNKVSGKGIAQLKAAGIEVITGIEEAACQNSNRRFFTFHEQQRPYVFLKWAQSADGFLAPEPVQQQMLSNPFSQRLVHKMRSEEAAILVGYQTARIDNPKLNNRLWTGPSPMRVVIDRDLSLPNHLHMFSDHQPTLIINGLKNANSGTIRWRKMDFINNTAASILNILHEENLLSVLIEGGSQTLDLFLASGLWDEAFIVQTGVTLQRGIPAPGLRDAHLQEQYALGNDQIAIFIRQS